MNDSGPDVYAPAPLTATPAGEALPTPPGTGHNHAVARTYRYLDANEVAEQKKAAAKAAMVYFASDEDREGEAISWHLTEALRDRKAIKAATQVSRVTFNAITKSAVTEAMAVANASGITLSTHDPRAPWLKASKANADSPNCRRNASRRANGRAGARAGSARSRLRREKR